MPNYEYKCEPCQTSACESRPMDKRHEGPECFVCGKPMQMALTAPGVTWKTGGRHSDDYSKTGPRRG